MTAATAPSHIQIDAQGVAWIDQTGLRVLDLAREHLAHGWDADTLADNHPPLTLAQAHSALAWFYDNQRDFEIEMSRRDAVANEFAAKAEEGSLQTRLRAIKATRSA